MRLSDLRAKTHLATVGKPVIVHRADGHAFAVELRCEADGQRYYHVVRVDGAEVFDNGSWDTCVTMVDLRQIINAALPLPVITEHEQSANDPVANAKADAVRKAITDAVEEAEAAGGVGKAIPLPRSVFLATRKRVDSICDAMGVAPTDCVIDEAEEDQDIAGWTYVDGYGSDVYMVQYPNGMVGAELGGYQIYARTLEEAERHLCDYVECTDGVTIEAVRYVRDTAKSETGRHAALTLLYGYWLADNGMPNEGCAGELLIGGETSTGVALTADQRKWLAAFYAAWEGV